MRLRSQFIVITISLTMLALLTGALGFKLLSNLEKTNQQWHEFTNKEAIKSQALADISQHFGYGGFIHHFKNYVLRKDPVYLTRAENAMTATYSAVDDYLKVTADDEEAVCIARFTTVVDQYQNKVNLLNSNELSHDLSIADIDTQVKVNDQLALEALADLSQSIKSRSQVIQKTTKDKINQSYQLLLVGGGMLLVVFLVVIGIIISISMNLIKTIRYNQLLFKHAPDAMLVLSESGSILQVNQKACLLFGYVVEEFLQLNVDDLVPSEIRPYHRKFRDEYLKNNALILDGRSMPFSAISKSGRKLPVEVSLMQHQSRGKFVNVATIKDISKQEELKWDSQTDHLTQLYNRRTVDRRVAELMKSEEDLAFGLMLMDIDHFKKVNDLLGHQKGDDVLVEVAKVLKNMTPEGSIVGRFGGEEFIMVCPYFDAQQVQDLGELIRLAIQQKIIVKDAPLTMSIGMTVYQAGDGIVNVLSRADSALYQAKSAGRNQVVYYRKPVPMA